MPLPHRPAAVVLVAAALTAGCAHPESRRAVPRPVTDTSRPAALPRPAAAAATPVVAPAAAGALGSARAFARAALDGRGSWPARVDAYTTVAFRRAEPPAPPATGGVH